jgi:hypothetical protein
LWEKDNKRDVMLPGEMHRSDGEHIRDDKVRKLLFAGEVVLKVHIDLGEQFYWVHAVLLVLVRSCDFRVEEFIFNSLEIFLQPRSL